jgi:hypothetical protein
MKGDLPSFNDWHNTLVDEDKGLLYIFGGCRPEEETPCSDFYRCDLKTFRWEDLIVSFPFSFLTLFWRSGVDDLLAGSRSPDY